MDAAPLVYRAAITLLAACCAQSLLAQGGAPSVRQAGRLQPHQSVERNLAPGQTDIFTVEASAGQFIHVVAHQEGVDVAVAIVSPDGKTLVTCDSPNGIFGPEPASVIATANGVYQVRVSAAEAPAGRYSLELAGLRIAADPDTLRIRAEGLLPGAMTFAAKKETWPQAIQKIREAVSAWHELRDSYEEALSLYELGSLYHDAGDDQQALELELQATPLFQAAGDRAGEGWALAETGVVYWVRGDKRRALEYLEKAEPILGAVGDRSLQAETLSVAANAYMELGQPKIALDHLTRSLPLFRAAGNRAGESRALNNAGKIYDDLGQKDKALDFYRQALNIRRALNDRGGQAHTLNNISTLYSESGQKQKALAYINQALPLFREVADHSGEAWALIDLGKISADLSDKRKAVECYTQALSIFRALQDREGEARGLNNLGKVYSDLGENHKALDYHNRALALQRARGDRTGEAACLGNIGGIYAFLSENQKALDYFESALRINRETGDRSSEATNLDNLGFVYEELGAARKGLEYRTQALKILHEIGNRAGEATAMNNIGASQVASGQYQEALRNLEQALAIARDVGDRIEQATVLNNLGTLYARLGEPSKRLLYDTQALETLQGTGNLSGEARELNNLGAAYSDSGDNRKALGFFVQSLALSRATGERRNEASILVNISNALKALGNPDSAILFGKQAVNLLQGIRRDNQNLTDELKHSYEKSIESAYRNLAALLVDRQRFGEAEEVLNLLKDKEASDFIRRDGVADQLRAATLLDAEKKALERYEQIVGQVVTIGQRKAALVAKSDSSPLTAAELEESGRLDRDLAASNTVLLRYLDEQERAFGPGSAAVKRTGEFREAEGLQDTLAKLGPDVVAIYTLVLPDKYIAMVVTSGARKVYTTPIKEADLNKKIFEFRQLLQNPASDPLPLAQELYRVVFPEGLRQDLDAAHIQTIMWSVDGALRYFPIAALHDGKDYLVRRFRNSLITPASLTRLTESSTKVWDGIGFGVSEAKADFPALPSVPEELHGIFRQSETGAAPIAGSIRLNAQFTRTEFENDLRGGRNRVVHIATHFATNPGVAANSHLLLGDGSELSLADIEAETRLFNGVDLLTISACSTAFTNRSEDGREIDSFGTIAQRLGAKGVIASLWSVNDLATARLMAALYRERQQHPELGKSEALRRAQERMLGGELRPDGDGSVPGRGTSVPRAAQAHDWSHPFYWAPFILIGNWR